MEGVRRYIRKSMEGSVKGMRECVRGIKEGGDLVGLSIPSQQFQGFLQVGGAG